MSEIVCPSGFAFAPRKLSGRIMAQLAAKPDIDDLSSIVAGCCVEVVDAGPYALGDKDHLPNWKRVITGDLAYAFVRIRALSIPPSHDGELFQWRIKCANTGCVDEKGKRTEFFWRVQLCDLPVIPLSAEARDRVKRGNDSFPGKLLDGRGITFKLPTDEDGPVIRRLLRESGISPKDVQPDRLNEAIRPFAMAACVTSIEGLARDAVATEIIDLDPWSQTDIQRQLGEVDGGFDTFQGKCDACGTVFDLALPFSPQLLLSLSSTELRAKPKPSSEELRGSSTTASPG